VDEEVGVHRVTVCNQRGMFNKAPTLAEYDGSNQQAVSVRKRRANLRKKLVRLPQIIP
jgi:hypothetical protein